MTGVQTCALPIFLEGCLSALHLVVTFFPVIRTLVPSTIFGPSAPFKLSADKLNPRFFIPVLISSILVLNVSLVINTSSILPPLFF